MAFAQLVCLLSIIQDDLCQFHEPPRVRLRFSRFTYGEIFMSRTPPRYHMKTRSFVRWGSRL
jgi:hypothetical protein